MYLRSSHWIAISKGDPPTGIVAVTVWNVELAGFISSTKMALDELLGI